MCAVVTLTSSSGSASASVKRRKGTIPACGGCRNARPRRRNFSRRISRNRCSPIFRSEIFRIREIVIRKFPNPKNFISFGNIFFAGTFHRTSLGGGPWTPRDSSPKLRIIYNSEIIKLGAPFGKIAFGNIVRKQKDSENFRIFGRKW